jgi:2-oxoisovalerate dehydrogenase E2 component (dihydrolipoyl transacylase)
VPRYEQFRLPDLGEGLTEGEILQWLVAPGDRVTLNQPIVEVETAKAAVEVPSPYAGLVSELHHQAGETVDVGSPIITFDVDPDGAAAPDGHTTPAPAKLRGLHEDLVPAIPSPGEDEAVEPGLIGGPAPGGRTSVLVGYGPREHSAARRARRPAAGAPETGEPPAEAPAAGPAAAPSPPARVSAAAVAERAAQVSVLAKPPVRKLARDLGIDLRTVNGTGPAGTITRADVQANAGEAPGGEERIAVRGVRKVMAEAMVSSAFGAPHVTEFLTVDVTASMELLQRLKARPEFAGVRVSPLLLAARALLLAARRHPLINSSWDEAAGEIVVHPQVNLGIAAATPRGLVVPNIKGAEALSLAELARRLGELATTAREGHTQPADMQRGTITITNVGVFGVDTGTPILNPGEVAILCLGAIRPTPWVHDGAIAIRQVTQLGLSFDHRVVDGQLGSQVLSDVGAVLEDPTLLAVWG